jgi:hypothetical protein
VQEIVQGVCTGAQVRIALCGIARLEVDRAGKSLRADFTAGHYAAVEPPRVSISSVTGS